MTKKDYIKIAEAIRSTRASLADESTNADELDRIINITALTMAVMLHDDNKLFKTDKFLKACGFGE